MQRNSKPIEILLNAVDGCLSAYNIGHHIAVACSGGSDSLALALITKKYCDQHNVKLTILIVDHGLRDGSDKEALYCANILKTYHISYIILTLDGQYHGNMQKWARDYRYKIMAKKCHALDIAYLLVAHHEHDMAENFLMNIKRHSDIRGLSSLRTTMNYDNRLTIMRPFLNIPKHILSDFIHNEAITPIQDPSNDNDAFLRVKMRQQLHKINAFNTKDIARICHHLQAYDDATQIMVKQIAHDYIHYHEYFIMLDWQKLTAHIPLLLLGRLLGDLFCGLSDHEYPPKRNAVNHIIDKIQKATNSQNVNCYGQLYHCHYHYRQSKLWLISCQYQKKIGDTYPSKKQFMTQHGKWAKKLCDDMPWQIIKYLPDDFLDNVR